MSQYIPKSFRRFGGNINVKIDLLSYATKADIDKLVSIPVDVSKLSDVIKNDVAKKAVYDKLVAKVNNIGTSRLVLKTKYQTGKAELEKKFLM